MRFCTLLLAMAAVVLCTLAQPNQLMAQPLLTDPTDSTEPSVEHAVPDEAARPKSRFNLATKTGGGTQLWTDYLNRDGYRIQQNALTHHWRLLDPDDIRRAWGTRQQCEAVLDATHPRQPDPDLPTRYVVLLHGLMRTHHCMKSLDRKLTEQGYRVVRFSYASTRSSISNHAQALREVLEELPANAEFRFVGHSMGNIVIRHMIGDLQRDGDPQGIVSRSRSMVMLGPPNQGAAISRRLAPTGLYGLITGTGGLELGPRWDAFVHKLATPPFPFAIIAGDLSKLPIQNPLVDGSSDFIVSVEEATLEGSEWIKTVPVLHSWLMADPATMQVTIEFLQSH